MIQQLTIVMLFLLIIVGLAAAIVPKFMKEGVKSIQELKDLNTTEASEIANELTTMTKEGAKTGTSIIGYIGLAVLITVAAIFLRAFGIGA